MCQPHLRPFITDLKNYSRGGENVQLRPMASHKYVFRRNITNMLFYESVCVHKTLSAVLTSKKNTSSTLNREVELNRNGNSLRVPLIETKALHFQLLFGKI